MDSRPPSSQGQALRGNEGWEWHDIEGLNPATRFLDSAALRSE